MTPMTVTPNSTPIINSVGSDNALNTAVAFELIPVTNPVGNSNIIFKSYF